MRRSMNIPGAGKGVIFGSVIRPLDIMAFFEELSILTSDPRQVASHAEWKEWREVEEWQQTGAAAAPADTAEVRCEGFIRCKPGSKFM